MQKTCPKCRLKKPHSDFYVRKNGKLTCWCKSCLIDLSENRQKETKLQGIQYLGGCCSVCGYARYEGALEFHHVDPEKKDPKWNTMKTRSFEKLKSELDKCILLCANCHREKHGGLI